MKNSIVLVAAALLCLVAFPTTTVGKNLKYWPKPIEGWPKPSELRKGMFMSTAQKYNYGDSKVWKCTYSNGSSPAISVSYPTPPTHSTPSNPSPSTPSTPSPTPKTSPPPPTPSPPPPTPKTSPPPPTPSPTPPTPKQSPPPPVPSLPPPTPKKSPSPPPPSEQIFHPYPTPKKSPSPPPPSEQPSFQNWLEHIESCSINMIPLGQCQMQIELTYHTGMFGVSNECCNLVVTMRHECNDIAFGIFLDPFFLPLVRSTCHVNLY